MNRRTVRQVLEMFAPEVLAHIVEGLHCLDHEVDIEAQDFLALADELKPYGDGIYRLPISKKTSEFKVTIRPVAALRDFPRTDAELKVLREHCDLELAVTT